MFKEMKQRKKQKKNTLELKFLSCLEEIEKIKEKLIVLQGKIIILQEQNIKQKEELLAFREKEIKKLKEKRKW